LFIRKWAFKTKRNGMVEWFGTFGAYKTGFRAWEDCGRSFSDFQQWLTDIFFTVYKLYQYM